MLVFECIVLFVRDRVSANHFMFSWRIFVCYGEFRYAELWKALYKICTLARAVARKGAGGKL